MSRSLLLVAISALLVSTAAPARDVVDAAALRTQALRSFQALEATGGTPAATAQLGRALFWDARLSRDGKTACATCHLSEDWGADRRAASVDARGRSTARNSPTVFNAMAQPALRWLGDRPSGSVLSQGLITAVLGFDNREEAVRALKEAAYEGAFREAFPADAQPLSVENYGKALEAYMTTLVTPSPFDRFLAGDTRALGAAQQRGLKVFVEGGCAGCHRGALLGGEGFQRFGLTKDYWTETRSAKVDTGRFAATNKEEDRYVFRVPMLRNVAKTAPYFHDGSVADLGEAVRIMARTQLGKELEAGQVRDIVAFLESLTGEVPAHYAPPGRSPQASR